MQTLHTVLKRGLFTWNQMTIPISALETRLRAVQTAIADCGHAAWLIYGDAQHFGNVAYISNFVPRTRGAAVLVPQTGAPSLLVSSGPRDIPWAKNQTWIEDVRPYTYLPRAIAQLLTERHLQTAKVGFAGIEESLPINDWEEIHRVLPNIKWENVSDYLAAMRAAKDTAEIHIMHQAASVVEKGLNAATKALQPGASERQALAAVDQVIRSSGAEDARFLIASGPRASLSLRPPDDRVLQHGDVILLHIAVEFQRYWAEAAKTYVLGAADTQVRELVDLASATVTAMAAVARAEIQACAVATTGVNTLKNEKMTRTALAYGLGHGIGIDLNEMPSIHPNVTETLAENTTLALHIVLHSEEGLGAIAGQTMVIGVGGAQPLVSIQGYLVECFD